MSMIDLSESAFALMRFRARRIYCYVYYPISKMECATSHYTIQEMTDILWMKIGALLLY